MSQRALLIVARVFFGLLTLAAIITQLVIQVQNHYSVVNFFSYFTNLSNIFASVVFLIGALYLAQRREPTPAEDLIRGASVVAMAVVGIVFSILLRNEDLGSLLPWVNTVLHYIMPVVMVADWLLQPPRARLALRQAGYWLIYPALYLVYSLIRGALVGFYPYPFLNPATAGGAGGVALYCVAIFILFVLLGLALISLANARTRAVAARVA